MKYACILPLLLLAAACGGGLDSHEGALEAQIEVMNDMADTLKTIKDKKSAEAAKPKLLALKKRGDEIEKAMQKLKGEPDPKAIEKMQADFAKAMKNFVEAMQGLPADPEVQKVMRDLDLG